MLFEEDKFIILILEVITEYCPIVNVMGLI